ncbi:MAG: GerMN domain-containing protein [Terracidiphilus sp.]
MIPRHQKLLFGILLLASLAMGVTLWQLRERAHQRLIAGQDSAPTRAPEVAPAEQATLLVANDSDSSLLTQVHSLPLPDDPGARARAVLGKLLDLYAAPDAAHPVPGGGSSVLQVFLLPAPRIAAAPESARPKPPESATGETITVDLSEKRADAAPQAPRQSGPQLAVVNLTGSFAASHPSGIETETLTVLSICGTLHANLPRVTQVRFLVDGQQRATLAGHADLTRTYLTADAAPGEGAHP